MEAKKKPEPRMAETVRLGDVIVSEAFAKATSVWKLGSQSVYDVRLDDPGEAEDASLRDPSRGEAEYVVVMVTTPRGRRSDSFDFEVGASHGYRGAVTVCAFRVAADGICDKDKCDAVSFKLERDALGFVTSKVKVVGKMDVRHVVTKTLVIGARIE